MEKMLLFNSIYLFIFCHCYSQELPPVEHDSTGISDLGLYNGNLAEVNLFKNASVIFGPSINENSMLNFYEFPVLLQFTKQKWTFYTGGQLNWMLDRKELLRGNRFGGDTFGASIPAGIRYDLNKETFMEFKYSRNIAPGKMKTLFNSIPSSKSLFEFGAGFKF